MQNDYRNNWTVEGYSTGRVEFTGTLQECRDYIIKYKLNEVTYNELIRTIYVN